MSIYRLRELCLLRIQFSLSIHLLSLIWSLVEGAAAKAGQPRFLSPQLLCPALPCLTLLSEEKEHRFYSELRDQTNCSPKHTFWWGRPLWGQAAMGAGHDGQHLVAGPLLARSGRAQFKEATWDPPTVGSWPAGGVGGIVCWVGAEGRIPFCSN